MTTTENTSESARGTVTSSPKYAERQSICGTKAEMELAKVTVPVVMGEIIAPLSPNQAKALDKKIRASSDKVETNLTALLELLEEAARGAIHRALGVPTWTAYVKDAVRIQVSGPYERKEVAKLLSGKGLSQRAIAPILGVTQQTVSNDLAGDKICHLSR